MPLAILEPVLEGLSLFGDVAVKLSALQLDLVMQGTDSVVRCATTNSEGIAATFGVRVVECGAFDSCIVATYLIVPLHYYRPKLAVDHGDTRQSLFSTHGTTFL